MEYAGFWRRFVASIIDAVITFILSAVAGFVVGLVIGFVGGLGGTPPDRVAMASQLAGGLAGFALWFVYFAAFESSARQATPGKMALGIAVVDDGGRPLAFGRAFARNAAKLPSAMILWIGFLMAAFTQRKQALHDLLTGCLVVRR